MTNFKKIFYLALCFSLIASCGRKSGLTYKGETQQKKFKKNIEKNDFGNSDKNFEYYFDIKQPAKKPKKENPKKRGNLDYFDKKPVKKLKSTEEIADEDDAQQNDEDESQDQ